MATEYLWLEERVKISDGVTRDRSEFGAWPGKCLVHRNGMEGKMKEFIQELQKSILPTEDIALSRLEEILCCCGQKQSHKSVIGRYYGYTAGTNLPQEAHEERQMHLIEQFHNIFNNIATEHQDSASVDAVLDVRIQISKFLEEVMESHRYMVYNPAVVRLLHILKHYIEKPLFEYVELPLLDFIRLIEGPKWEECAEKLRTKFCTNIYVDFNNDVIDAGNIGIYLEGPSVHELKGVKSNLTTYIDQTINPPKEKETKETGAEKNETKDEEKKTEESVETNSDKAKSEQEEGKVVEDKKQIENVSNTTTESESPDGNKKVEDSGKEVVGTHVNDKKRDSRSVDRTAELSETSNKEVFMRSKSVPATSSTEVQESQTQKAKRAKYDSECSNEMILQSDPVQELTLFKETLSLVLVNRLEDNNHSLVDL